MEPVVNDESIKGMESDGVQLWWLQVKEFDQDDWITVVLTAAAIALVACLAAVVLAKFVSRCLRVERDQYKRYLYDVINSKSSVGKKRS